MAKRLTYEEVKQFVEENSKCVLLSTDYINNNSKLKFKCGCGNVFETTFDKFKGRNKRQCDVCSKKAYIKKRATTNEEFLKKVNKLVGNEYSFLEPYINNHKKIKVKHNECGYIYEISPDNFLSGSKCPKCQIKKTHDIQRKTNKDFLNEVYEKYKNEYSVLNEYINANTKVLIKHNVCGYEWNILPNIFLKGHNCPKCNHRSYKKTTEEFKNEVYELVKEEYSVLGEYKNNKNKILIRHNKCGHEFKTTPANFACAGTRCPKCNESHGERIVTKYLGKNHIKFRSQYRIKECKNIKSLPFDFALFNKDSLMALVEFDGRQHVEMVRCFGGEEGLKKRQHNDSIKTNYCLTHNIPLIRISYTVKNIEEYLDNELKKLNIKIQLSIL